MKDQLINTSYQKLVSDISEIYQKAKLHTAKTLNKIIVFAYWRIGERTVKEEQDNRQRAQYGAKLLENLSGDLSGKFGNGFSATNLRHMRQLYILYPIQHPSAELGWTHYRHLLSVRDKEKRHFYESEIIESGWTARRLEERLKKDKASQQVNIRRRTEKVRAAPRLSFKRGELYTYRIIQPEYISRQEGNVVVDCGFHINTEVAVVEITKPRPEEIVKCVRTAKGNYLFKGTDTDKSKLYTYKAFVEKVTDADTIWVNIDVGFNIWIRQKLRLRGIDAPEVSLYIGKKAKKFVEAQLSRVPFIIIKTYSPDKYGRYLVDVFYPPVKSRRPGITEGLEPQCILEEGVFLNQQLLDLGLAKML